jgi:hypothetical protein
MMIISSQQVSNHLLTTDIIAWGICDIIAWE